MAQTMITIKSLWERKGWALHETWCPMDSLVSNWEMNILREGENVRNIVVKERLGEEWHVLWEKREAYWYTEIPATQTALENLLRVKDGERELILKADAKGLWLGYDYSEDC